MTSSRGLAGPGSALPLTESLISTLRSLLSHANIVRDKLYLKASAEAFSIPGSLKSHDTRTISASTLEVSSLISDCITQFDASAVDNDSVGNILNVLTLGMNFVSRAEISTAQLDVVTRLQTQTLARCLIFVYQWYTSVGPHLAKIIFQAHQHLDAAAFADRYPRFCRLIEHIVASVQLRKNTKTSKKRKKVNHAADGPDTQSESSNPVGSAVPQDLFGLFPGQKGKAIPLTYSDRALINMADVYHVSQTTFLDLLSNALILPIIIPIDTKLNGGTRFHSKVPKTVQARTILRGAVLLAVSNAVGGDDAIFGCKDAQELVRSAALSIGTENGGHVESCASLLCSNGEFALANIKDWLDENFDTVASADIGEVGDILWRTNKWITTGKRPSEARPRLRLNVTQTLNPLLATPGALLPLDEVLVTADAPHLEIVSYMLREVLCKKRGLHACDEALRRISDGQRPFSNGNLRYADYCYDPLCSQSTYALNLTRLFGHEELSSEYGLSNLAMFMATGQCPATSAFLGNSFSMTSVAGAVNRFHDAYAAGIDFENCCVWGQSAKSINITRSHTFKNALGKHSVREAFGLRLEAFFTLNVLTAWRNFIGNELFELDVSFRREGKRRTWCSAFNMFCELGIEGLSSGITPMQAAHNLALLGYVDSATCDDMIDVIHANPDKGGWYGLAALGFRMDRSRRETTATAFYTLYAYLSRLSKDDQSAIDLSPMFVENFLCKIKRWDDALAQGAKAAANPNVKCLAMRVQPCLLAGYKGAAFPLTSETRSQGFGGMGTVAP